MSASSVVRTAEHITMLEALQDAKEEALDATAYAAEAVGLALERDFPEVIEVRAELEARGRRVDRPEPQAALKRMRRACVALEAPLALMEGRR